MPCRGSPFSRRQTMTIKAFICWAAAVFICGAASAQTPTTQPAVLARIALVSDTHCTRGEKEEQPRYHARLDKVIAAANAAKVDLVLIAGDLTEDGKPEQIIDFKE